MKLNRTASGILVLLVLAVLGYILFSVPPFRADFFRTFKISPPRSIGRQVTIGWIGFTTMIQQRVCQRAEYRLGMLPTNAVQRAIAVGHVDRFVTDAAKITSAKTCE